MLELQTRQGYLTSMLNEEYNSVAVGMWSAACLGCYLSRLSSCYQAQLVQQKGYSTLARELGKTWISEEMGKGS